MFQPLWASLVTLGVGAATWIVVAMYGGRREAWDSELYWTFVMPAIALTAGIVSYKVPVRTWRWAMFPFAAQALVGFVQNPTANLLPLGLIMFAIVGAMCLIPARIGALASRKPSP
jgi:peptidoglycan/LPS O-acetylase OafA/YrhL